MIEQGQERKLQQPPVLVVRPEGRMARLYYRCAVIMAAVIIVPTIIAVTVVMILLPMDLGLVTAIVIFLYAGGIASLVVSSLAFLHMSRRQSVYTVTPEYVAVETDLGIWWRNSRRIPISYIRDVTTDSWLLQRYYDVGSVTVSATNGDKITFQDITDADAARETIWQLVEKAASKT